MVKKIICYVVVWNSKQLDNNATYLSEWRSVLCTLLSENSFQARSPKVPLPPTGPKHTLSAARNCCLYELQENSFPPFDFPSPEVKLLPFLFSLNCSANPTVSDELNKTNFTNKSQRELLTAVQQLS